MKRATVRGSEADGRVWDLPTRVFHWALVLLVAASYLTGEFWRGIDMQWHKFSGYAILALLLFRIAWGFLGTRHARFGEFLRPPREVVGYAVALLRGRAPTYAGHNPLGGLSVLAFLLVLLVQAGSGLFASDDIFVEGPLAGLVSGDTVDLMTSVHHFSFNLVIALVALHLAALAFYEGAKGQRLLRAMLTGRKPGAPGGISLAPLGGLALLAVSVALVAGLVWGLPALVG